MPRTSYDSAFHAQIDARPRPGGRGATSAALLAGQRHVGDRADARQRARAERAGPVARQRVRLGLLFGIGAYACGASSRSTSRCSSRRRRSRSSCERFVFSLRLHGDRATVTPQLVAAAARCSRDRRVAAAALAGVGRSSRSTGASTSGRSTTATSSRRRSATSSTRSSLVLIGMVVPRRAAAAPAVDRPWASRRSPCGPDRRARRLPWIALALAFSFAGYGIVKKLVGVDPMASLTIETAYALAVRAGLPRVPADSSGRSCSATRSAGNTVLLMGTGVDHGHPAACCSAPRRTASRSRRWACCSTSRRSSSSSSACSSFGETMPPARWAGFVIVWIALAVFTYDGLRQGGRNRTARRPRPPTRRRRRGRAAGLTACAHP